VEMGAETPEGMIFAIGRDSAVPHSSGNPADVLSLGKTIIFDLYPCETGGGYFYDMTRTWCLGYAQDEAQEIFEQVASVVEKIRGELKIDVRFQSYQQRACELFENMDHPTIRSLPNTEKGYVHSLGHGVGLHIHEQPWAGVDSTERDILAPNTVFTIEPGLYYPDKGIGVRLEDTYWTRPDGKFEPLAQFPQDLVLPIKQ
jgi:Xaa-Pro aminopeptidase